MNKMIKRWKCKNCNHFNEITEEQQKKEKRDFAIVNTSLIILSGGLWFLIMLMKDLMLFSFDTGSGGNGSLITAEKPKDSCKNCGAIKQ